MKIKFPLTTETEVTLILSKPDARHGLTKRLTEKEFDALENGISSLREQVTGKEFVRDTEPASFGDTEPASFGDAVLVDVSTLQYAATALESSADRGDRYAASQIRDALRQPHATYDEDENDLEDL